MLNCGKKIFHLNNCKISAKKISDTRKHTLAFFCECIGRFVSNLVGNPKEQFSCVAAQIIVTFPDSLSFDYNSEDTFDHN